jgi:hypothetical protein
MPQIHIVLRQLFSNPKKYRIAFEFDYDEFNEYYTRSHTLNKIYSFNEGVNEIYELWSFFKKANIKIYPAIDAYNLTSKEKYILNKYGIYDNTNKGNL